MKQKKPQTINEILKERAEKLKLKVDAARSSGQELPSRKVPPTAKTFPYVSPVYPHETSTASGLDQALDVEAQNQQEDNLIGDVKVVNIEKLPPPATTARLSPRVRLDLDERESVFDLESDEARIAHGSQAFIGMLKTYAGQVNKDLRTESAVVESINKVEGYLKIRAVGDVAYCFTQGRLIKQLKMFWKDETAANLSTGMTFKDYMESKTGIIKQRAHELVLISEQLPEHDELIPKLSYSRLTILAEGSSKFSGGWPALKLQLPDSGVLSQMPRSLMRSTIGKIIKPSRKKSKDPTLNANMELTRMAAKVSSVSTLLNVSLQQMTVAMNQGGRLSKEVDARFFNKIIPQALLSIGGLSSGISTHKRSLLDNNAVAADEMSVGKNMAKLVGWHGLFEMAAASLDADTETRPALPEDICKLIQVIQPLLTYIQRRASSVVAGYSPEQRYVFDGDLWPSSMEEIMDSFYSSLADFAECVVSAPKNRRQGATKSERDVSIDEADLTESSLE